MTYVSTAQMTQVRAQRAASLQSSCVIYTASDVTDTSGGYTNSWASGSTVACGITTPTTQAASDPGMVPVIGDERGVVIALPHGTGITPADRLVSGGITYEIVHVDKPGSFGVQVTCYCVER